MRETLHDLLRKLPPAQKRNWPRHLSQVIYAYNTTAHHVTGMTPYNMMFGCDPRPPVDFLLWRGFAENGGGGTGDWVQSYQESLRVAHSHVRQQLQAKAEKWNQVDNEKVNDKEPRTGESDGPLGSC